MTQRTAVENSALNIVVLVKYVPDAQFDRHLTGDAHRLDRNESILSELDEYALEAALALTDARGGAKGGNTVTALAPALCGIRASQAGDGNNAAAPQKLALINVLPTYSIAVSASPAAGGSVSCTPNPVPSGAIR